MDERLIQFRVGVVVLASAIVAVILTMLVGAMPGPRWGSYTLYVGFPTAPGVAVDTPIRKDGVLIGRVSHVKLLDGGGVLVTLRVDGQYKLPKGDLVRVGNASLLGDAIIEFVPGMQVSTPGEVWKDGDFRPDGIVTANPLEAVNVILNLEKDMKEAMQSVNSAGQEVAVSARNLNTIVVNNEDQLQRLLTKSELALENFNKAMIAVNDVVGDPELIASVKSSLKELPDTFKEAKLTLTQARQTLSGFEETSRRANTNLANLEKFTQPLGEHGDKIVTNIDSSIETLDTLLAQVSQLAERLNSSEGTFGRLVHDDELYQRLNNAATSIEQVTRDARPIVDDLKVFASKIADDPRQLGLKGMIDRRPSGVGFNFNTSIRRKKALEENAVWIED